MSEYKGCYYIQEISDSSNKEKILAPRKYCMGRIECVFSAICDNRLGLYRLGDTIHYNPQNLFLAILLSNKEFQSNVEKIVHEIDEIRLKERSMRIGHLTMNDETSKLPTNEDRMLFNRKYILESYFASNRLTLYTDPPSSSDFQLEEMTGYFKVVNRNISILIDDEIFIIRDNIIIVYGTPEFLENIKCVIDIKSTSNSSMHNEKCRILYYDSKKEIPSIKGELNAGLFISQSAYPGHNRHAMPMYPNVERMIRTFCRENKISRILEIKNHLKTSRHGKHYITWVGNNRRFPRLSDAYLQFLKLEKYSKNVSIDAFFSLCSSLDPFICDYFGINCDDMNRAVDEFKKIIADIKQQFNIDLIFTYEIIRTGCNFPCMVILKIVREMLDEDLKQGKITFCLSCDIFEDLMSDFRDVHVSIYKIKEIFDKFMKDDKEFAKYRNTVNRFIEYLLCRDNF